MWEAVWQYAQAVDYYDNKSVVYVTGITKGLPTCSLLLKGLDVICLPGGNPKLPWNRFKMMYNLKNATPELKEHLLRAHMHFSVWL